MRKKVTSLGLHCRMLTLATAWKMDLGRGEGRARRETLMGQELLWWGVMVAGTEVITLSQNVNSGVIKKAKQTGLSYWFDGDCRIEGQKRVTLNCLARAAKWMGFPSPRWEIGRRRGLGWMQRKDAEPRHAEFEIQVSKSSLSPWKIYAKQSPVLQVYNNCKQGIRP